MTEYSLSNRPWMLQGPLDKRKLMLEWKEIEAKAIMTDIEQLEYMAKNWNGYPCTIMADRYGGGYSGGQWLAFAAEVDEVPCDVNSGDLESMLFWNDEIRQYCGLGDTPEYAYKNLCTKIMKRNEV